MSALTAGRAAITVAAVIRALEQRGIELSLEDDLVRWRGAMSCELLEDARHHREAIAEYLRRRCARCGRSRPVMLLMETSTTVWWLCGSCWRG